MGRLCMIDGDYLPHGQWLRPLSNYTVFPAQGSRYRCHS